MRKPPGSYRLTQRIASTWGGAVVSFDANSLGRRFHLFESRPSAKTSERVYEAPEDEKGALIGSHVTLVRVYGPIEQRSGYHDCGGWAEGHDAISERLVEAFEVGDVVLVMDSPGGAVAGIQEGTRRAVEARDKKHRNCYVYADELIASAAYWWACSVANGGIYCPESGLIGSIGARSGHVSEAEALKKAGIETTYFFAPGDGKIAFAPEFPLSEVGRKRGERDVVMAYKAFAATVSKARGLKTEAIDKLNADLLPGKMAVKVGLADGISSLEDVVALAIEGAKESE